MRSTRTEVSGHSGASNPSSNASASGTNSENPNGSSVGASEMTAGAETSTSNVPDSAPDTSASAVRGTLFCESSRGSADDAEGGASLRLGDSIASRSNHGTSSRAATGDAVTALESNDVCSTKATGSEERASTAPSAAVGYASSDGTADATAGTGSLARGGVATAAIVVSAASCAAMSSFRGSASSTRSYQRRAEALSPSSLAMSPR